jgi:proline-rich protein PRCC
VPPEPTPNDEYPGYYRIPSGAWAAYDPDYYRKFYNKWQAEYNAHVRALEKGMVKGFEGLETTGAQDVNAQEEMERAKKDIQEREERKAVTHGAEGGLKAPRMNIQVSATPFLHRLATLGPSFFCLRARNWAAEHALVIS